MVFSLSAEGCNGILGIAMCTSYVLLYKRKALKSVDKLRSGGYS
jgi:hypothetical protein